MVVMMFQVVQEHFSTDNGCRAAKCSHGIFATITLHETTQPALLALGWHVGRCGNNSRQAGVAAYTVCCAHWGHSHTDGATQDHGWLTQHRLWLMVLWLSILRLLWWILCILRLTICLWLLRIWPGHCLCSRSIELPATASTETHTGSVLVSTTRTVTSGGGCGCIHILSAVGAENRSHRNFGVARRTWSC